jgi:RNA polymerase sigma-70 factor (ECF subfamily)
LYDIPVANETSLGGTRRAFEPTAWTVILRAQEHSRAALEELIRLYWKPCYYFIRRWGASIEAAKDLTQGFFAEFLERDFLKDVSKEKGRFRSFLLVSLRHYLVNQAEHARAKKRGGGIPQLSLDFSGAESDYSPTTSTEEDLDGYFRRQWALALLERGLVALAGELPTDRLEAIRIYLTPGGAPPYEETAARLGTTVPKLKHILHRARSRYRELIRQEVRASVESEEAAEEELRDLFTAL